MKENMGSKIWKVFERFVLFCLRLILKPVKKELTPEQEQAFMQFVKFALVGVTNTIVSWLIIVITIFSLNHTVGEDPKNKFIANCVGWFLSVLWAFILSNKFVFKESEDGEKRVWWQTLLKTYAAYAFTGLGVSNLVSYISVDIFGISEYIAPAITLVISVPINFVINKFWAYRQKDKAPVENIEETAETENV